ncbi:CBS domain-containing protein [Candidatus Bathyarchaeota archaeon]|nr:CBS domain-containing protein [Candidatus Bathyarchaeota archaeon]
MLPSIEDIVKKRKMLGLTQKQLAKLAGVSQSLIAKLESRKINPSYEKVKAIFDALENLEIKTDFKAADVLHNGVVGVKKGSLVADAVKLMMEHGYSQLPVFDGEKVIGSISEKTILELMASGKDLSEISRLAVEEIMDESFPQVGKNTPLRVVSDLLQVYPAVLVSEKGKVIGIITKADLLKVLV